MSIFENQQCPVCNREFVDDDVIVVCPECGTPHHRECYDLIGHCVNKGLHKAGYDYTAEFKQQKEMEEKTASESANEYYQPQNDNSAEDANPNSIPNPFSIPDIDAKFENDREKISGEDVGDIAAAVRINADKYIPKFKKLEAKNGKLGWNWSAFFFGSFYLLHRKMYQFGIGCYSLILAVFYGASALIYKVAPEFMKSITELAEMTAQKITPTNEQMEAIMSIPDTSKAQLVVYGMLGIILVFHIIIALFADHLYKKQIVSIVKSVKKQLDNGASFTSATIGMGPNGLEMSQEQMKKMYLARKGGTSFMAPMIALLLLSIVL